MILALALVPRLAFGGAWGLSELAETIAVAGSGTYRFSEERHLQILTEPIRLEGTLSYDQSGRLVRQVTSPKPEKAVIEGNLLSIEANKADPPLRIVLSGQPVLNALVIALRATLQGDVDLLQDTYDTELTGSRADWSLRLLPKDAGLREAVREVRLQGGEERIGTIEILETSGDRAVITIIGDQ